MEPVGLVVGCAGLATLFDSCMSALEYFDDGKNYGEDYQRAALKINVLRLRLTRWRACVQLVDDVSSVDKFILGQQHLRLATDEDVNTVKTLLGDIGALLNKAERTSTRYGSDNPLEKGMAEANDTVQDLICKVKTLSLRRQKSASLLKKARWALRDKRKLENLIADLTDEVEALLNLFPTLQPQQQKLAKEDVVEIVEPSEVEDAPESVKQLEQAAESVDQDLLRAVKSELLRGHTYNNTIARGNARLLNGDTILTPGMQMTGRRHEYNGVYLEGSARVQNGDQYGGKSIFED